MGRARKTNTHLPQRVYIRHGSYRYRPAPVEAADGTIVQPPEKNLGHNEAEMWRNWHQLDAVPDNPISTMGDLMDAYAREKLPEREPGTARDEQQSMKMLRKVFAASPVGSIRPTDCYQYLRGRKAKTRANRELACLSNVMKYAIELGLVDVNPTLKVTRNKERRRERKPETWELAEVMAASGSMLRAYILLKVLMGLRQGDMLALRRDQIDKADGGGIFHRISKVKREKIMDWSDELRSAVALAEAVPRPVGSMFLFATRKGQQYTSDGFRSIWHRAMRKALDAGTLKERFHEHDIRAHTATEAARLEGIQRAQELMAHANIRTTAIYLRDKEPERVRPLR